jgi:hypothetical protein
MKTAVNRDFAARHGGCRSDAVDAGYAVFIQRSLFGAKNC